MGNDSTVILEQSDSIADLTLTRPYSLNIAGKQELLNTFITSGWIAAGM